jgi:fido (protein-threonine AMPylation protein)
MREIPTYQPDFEEYIRQGEPDQKERAQIWRTAIGLQQVDGLETSEYLKEVARQHIEGDITLKDVKSLIEGYYKTEEARNTEDAEDKQEADKVSERIAELLSQKTFTFSPAQLVSIHRHLFQGIYKFAGKIRDYNITKNEWVLRGGTVYYASADSILETLEYDFGQEKAFDYSKTTLPESVQHIAKFCCDIWQIHPFGEGNTRTTAVFMIKYLRTLGFEVTNDLFAQHSWYFRNALVRANYRNVPQGVDYSPIYLERFFRNLLLSENHPLLNREMHLDWNTPASTPSSTPATSPASTEQVQDKFGTNSI